MSFRSQNKPPPSFKPSLPTPSSKKEGVGDSSLDKRQRLGVTKMTSQANPARTRQAFTVVNGSDQIAKDDSTSSECSVPELTKESVEAILNEKMKVRKSDIKGKCEYMAEYIKKLKLCVKWFQELDEGHLLEEEKLRSSLQCSEERCAETETQMRSKTIEFDTTIMEWKNKYASLEVKLAEVETEKLNAIESHKSEKEARLAVERTRASIAEDLQRAQQELRSANHRMDINLQIESLNATCNTSQEYNTSLQQYNRRLQNDCDTHKMNLKRMEDERAAIVDNLSTIRGQYSLLQNQVSSFQAARDEALKHKEALKNELGYLQAELKQIKDDRDRQHLQVQNLTNDLVKYKEITGKLTSEMDNLANKSNALEETCFSQKEELRVVQHRLVVANEKLKMADLTSLEARMEFEDQKRLVKDLRNRLMDSELQLVEAEKLRKKLHNTIQELKGNIRVFCRVRPVLPDDGDSTETPVIYYPTSTETLGRGIDLLQNGQKHQFTFDKVFNQDSSQKDVFGEISQLVQSALDGYKVCIFAYGQTGSGKTFTMMGKPVAPEQKGMIPRSLEQIFQTSQLKSAQGWKYKMQASMLEIYNDTIHDLLSTNRVGAHDNSIPGKQYTIRHDANGNTHVSDLTIIDVSSISEVSSLLDHASQSRSVGKTQMNEQSSRSHLVFTLRICGINESTEEQVQGILNLIDLAGSERLSKSGATGDRLRETQAINKSLSSLGDVIFALGKKQDHVPFRDSKLTYLLQPCLVGNSKILMFVNISPDPSSAGESLCALKFAAKVNRCEIGIPQRQTNVRQIDSRLSSG